MIDQPYIITKKCLTCGKQLQIIEYLAPSINHCTHCYIIENKNN